MAERHLDDDLLRALSHPLRLRLLARFHDEVTSPTRVAKKLNAPLATVAYHTRALVELGCLELVKTVPRRGALEHFYRAAVGPFFSDPEWERVPVQARKRLLSTVLRSVVSEVAGAFQAGAFEVRLDWHVSRTPLVLDEAGWAEINGMLDAVLDRALELRDQEVTTEDPISSSLVLMHFARP